MPYGTYTVGTQGELTLVGPQTEAPANYHAVEHTTTLPEGPLSLALQDEIEKITPQSEVWNHIDDTTPSHVVDQDYDINLLLGLLNNAETAVVSSTDDTHDLTTSISREMAKYMEQNKTPNAFPPIATSGNDEYVQLNPTVPIDAQSSLDTLSHSTINTSTSEYSQSSNSTSEYRPSSTSTSTASATSDMADQVENMISSPTADPIPTMTIKSPTLEITSVANDRIPSKVSVGTQMNRVSATLSDMGLPLDPIEANIYILGKELRQLAKLDTRKCMESIQKMTACIKDLSSGLKQDPDTAEFDKFMKSCK
jgi:hypothetical protein